MTVETRGDQGSGGSRIGQSEGGEAPDGWGFDEDHALAVQMGGIALVGFIVGAAEANEAAGGVVAEEDLAFGVEKGSIGLGPCGGDAGSDPFHVVPAGLDEDGAVVGVEAGFAFAGFEDLRAAEADVPSQCGGIDGCAIGEEAGIPLASGAFVLDFQNQQAGVGREPLGFSKRLDNDPAYGVEESDLSVASGRRDPAGGFVIPEFADRVPLRL